MRRTCTIEITRNRVAKKTTFPADGSSTGHIHCAEANASEAAPATPFRPPGGRTTLTSGFDFQHGDYY